MAKSFARGTRRKLGSTSSSPSQTWCGCSDRRTSRHCNPISYGSAGAADSARDELTLADSTMPIEPCRIVQLPVVNDVRGNLSFVEGTVHIPFDIKRVY